MSKDELKQLFQEIKDNKEAIEQLYNKYNRTIYAIAFSILKNKEDAEDVTQNVFMKISNLEKEKFPNDKEATWIYTVTKNEALAILKKKNKEINTEEIYEIEEQNNEIDEIIDKESFNKLISKLKDREKEILSLKIISNLSFAEIGKMLDEPTSTIKWRYYKSIYRIKTLITNMAMFIITIFVGTFAIKNSKKVNISQMAPDATMSEEEKVENQDSNQMEGMIEEIVKPLDKNEYNDNSTESIMGEKENSSSDSTNLEQEKNQENTITNQTVKSEIQTNNTNYLGIGILSFSTIFLISTIIITIFFKKHQLKPNKK